MEALLALVRALRAAGARVSLDTQFDASELWTGGDAHLTLTLTLALALTLARALSRTPNPNPSLTPGPDPGPDH